VVAAPPSELVDSALQVIAEGYGINWKPPSSGDGDQGGLKVCAVLGSEGLILTQQFCLLQESIPNREFEPPLLAESSAASPIKPNLPDEGPTDDGPSSSLAPSQSKQGSSEDDYESLRKRLDALRLRK
jgi:vacuolar protein sorting-associated protein IST1